MTRLLIDPISIIALVLLATCAARSIRRHLQRAHRDHFLRSMADVGANQRGAR